MKPCQSTFIPLYFATILNAEGTGMNGMQQLMSTGFGTRATLVARCISKVVNILFFLHLHSSNPEWNHSRVNIKVLTNSRGKTQQASLCWQDLKVLQIIIWWLSSGFASICLCMHACVYCEKVYFICTFIDCQQKVLLTVFENQLQWIYWQLLHNYFFLFVF